MATQLSSIEQYTQTPSYDNLVEVISVYLNREDEATNSAIPFFINAAEKVILRNLRMPSMEKLAKLSLGAHGVLEEGASDYYFIMPSDYLEMKHMWTNSGPMQRTPFAQFATWELSLENESSYNEGGPWVNPIGVWAVVGSRCYVKGIGTTEDIFLNYYKDIPEINSSTQSNVLLTLVPDAFVFLAVSEGWKFLQEEEKAHIWQRQGISRLQAVMQQVEDAEYSGSVLQIRPSMG